MNEAELQALVGSQAVGADGGRLGRVVGVQDGALVCQRGSVFPKELLVPGEEVASAGPGRVHLSRPAEAYLGEEATVWAHTREAPGPTVPGERDAMPMGADIKDRPLDDHFLPPPPSRTRH